MTGSAHFFGQRIKAYEEDRGNPKETPVPPLLLPKVASYTTPPTPQEISVTSYFLGSDPDGPNGTIRIARITWTGNRGGTEEKGTGTCLVLMNLP